MNANLRNFALWVIIVLLLLALFTLFQSRVAPVPGILLPAANEVDQGRVPERPDRGRNHGTFTDGRSFQTYAPNDPSLIQRLCGKGVSITARRSRTMCRGSCPFGRGSLHALISVWIFLCGRCRRRRPLGFGRSRAELLTEAHGRAHLRGRRKGVDEAKPSAGDRRSSCAILGKFQRLGGKIPRGVLLVVPAPARP
jgi:cell division protease FtsH